MSTPLPGWYQDPANPDQQKWWDGREWTTHTMPVSGPTPPAHTEPDTTQTPDPAWADTSGQSHVPLAQPARPDYPADQGYGGQSGYQGYQQAGQGYSQNYSQGYPGSPSAYPPYPGYPGFPGYPQMLPQPNPLALTGFVLGLISFFLFFIPVFGTAICLAAVVFSAVGLSRQKDRAPKYKVFGIIGLVLGIIFSLLSLLLTLMIFSGPYYY